MDGQLEQPYTYTEQLYSDFDHSLSYVEQMHSMQPELAEAEMKRALDAFELYCEYYEADEDLQNEDNESRIQVAKERIYQAMVKLRKV